MMEIEKDEFRSLHQKIAKKNQKLFYAERIFSDQYHEFIQNLLRVSQAIIDKEKDASKSNRANKLFRLIWTVFLTATLRTGNRDYQQQIFEWIFDALNKVIFYFLHLFIISET